MKKKIATAFMTLSTALCAQEGISVQMEAPVSLEITPALPSLKEAAKSTSFFYLRMGVADSELPTQVDHYLPGLGLGYRLAEGAYAVDFSTSFNQRTSRTDEGKVHTYTYKLPNATIVRYISPEKNNSFYAGGGLAWGGVDREEKTTTAEGSQWEERSFHGLIPNVTCGYEMKRHDTLRTFAELTISQPAIAASQEGKLPGPYAELSLGAGF